MSARRKLIIEALANRAAQIRVANGFNTDAGLTLFLGTSPSLGPDDPETAISLLVGRTRTTVDIESLKTITLPVMFDALAREDLANPLLAAESVIGDLKRAIETTDLTLGGLAEHLDPGEVESIPREDGTLSIGLRLEYLVRYTEAWGNPEA